MNPYHRRCPVVAHHEAGHVVAVSALGYKVKSARVFTMVESSHRDPFGPSGGMLFVNRGEVESENIFPADVYSQDVPVCEREPLRQKAIHMAICCLAGPVAQARYSKKSLAAILRSDMAAADKAVVDGLGADWFEHPSDLWVAALPVAYDVVGKRWNNLQSVADMLLRRGVILEA